MKSQHEENEWDAATENAIPAPASMESQSRQISQQPNTKATPTPEQAKDLKALLDELTRLDNTETQTMTRAEQIALRNRRAEVAKLVFEMQQGPTAPDVYDANVQAELRKTYLGFDGQVAATIEKLKNLVR